MTTTSSRPPLWTTLFCALGVANLAGSMVFWMLTSYLSAWSMDALGASQTQAGAVGAVYFGGAVLARLMAGPLLTHFGECHVVLTTMAVQLALCLTYLTVTTVWGLIALRAVHGVCLGIQAGALTGAALSRVPSSRRGEGSGWFTFGLAIATGIGPFLANRLPDAHAVFWANTGCAALALVMGLLVAPQLHTRPLERREGHSLRHDALDRRALPIGAVVMLCGGAFGLVLTFVGAFGRAIGLETAAGWYFLVYSLVIMVSRPAAGVLQDRIGDLRIIGPIVAATILGLALTAGATSAWMLLAGAAVLGLGYGTLIPAGQTVAINRVGAARAGVGVSSYFLLVDLGTGMGPLVLGSLVTQLGHRGAFWLATALAGTAALALVGVVRRDRGPLTS